MTQHYPADISPAPAVCYSVEKLTAGFVGGSPIVVQKIGSLTQAAIGFAGDVLDQSALSTFLTGEAYGRVVRFNNQMFSIGDAIAPTLVGQAPRIHPNIKIGASSCLLFQGGTEVGNVFGLDIPASIQSLGLTANGMTIMAVMRPTSSMYRNQQNANGLGEGTILSLDSSIPFQHSGKTTLGSAVIENFTPSAGIVPNMLLHGLPFPGGVRITTVSPTGPNTANITVFGSTATVSLDPVTLTSSNPIARFFQSGDASPGSFSYTDHFQVEVIPTDFSGAEIRPIVATWIIDATTQKDGAGVKIYQNEIIRSAKAYGFGVAAARTESIINGFIGKMGGGQPGGQSKSGDFWMSTLIIWNQALTQAQATIVRESLYTRYLITPSRSRRSSKSVTVVGDSIAIDYVTLGNYGWSKRLADKFPDTIRFMNYAVPGSQVTASIGTPDYGHTEGMFPISVARQMSYSKVGKNVLMILAGGNDMINTADLVFGFSYAANKVQCFADVISNGATATGETVLHFLPSSLPQNLSVGALVSSITPPNGIFGTATVTAIDFPAGAVTISNAALLDLPAGSTIRFRYHNLAVGSRVMFLTLPTDSLGNPLVGGVGFNTIYYVRQIPVTGDFTLATTPGGAEIDITGTNAGAFSVRTYVKNAADIFGTPTTHGLQKVVAMANAAGASKVYMLTVLPRVGIEYNFILPALNSLIMGGGAGGYTAIDSASLPALANNVPPGTQGPGYFDSGHLNEIGSQALADFLYPTLNAYLNS